MDNGSDERERAVHNITSNNQTGGITAHTVNVDRRMRRSLTDDLKSGLLDGLSKDRRPIAVMGLNGNTESMAFANEIRSFLKSHGHVMTTDTAMPHMFFDPPVFTVKVSPGNNGREWWIVVGPAE